MRGPALLSPGWTWCSQGHKGTRSPHLPAKEPGWDPVCVVQMPLTSFSRAFSLYGFTPDCLKETGESKINMCGEVIKVLLPQAKTVAENKALPLRPELRPGGAFRGAWHRADPGRSLLSGDSALGTPVPCCPCCPLVQGATGDSPRPVCRTKYTAEPWTPVFNLGGKWKRFKDFKADCNILCLSTHLLGKEIIKLFS